MIDLIKELQAAAPEIDRLFKTVCKRLREISAASYALLLQVIPTPNDPELILRASDPEDSKIPESELLTPELKTLIINAIKNRPQKANGTFGVSFNCYKHRHFGNCLCILLEGSDSVVGALILCSIESEEKINLVLQTTQSISLLLGALLENMLLKQSKASKLIASLKDSEEELLKSHRLVNALFEINTRFIAGAQPKKIFNELLEVLVNLTDSKMGFIGEVKYAPYGRPYLKLWALSNVPWSDETKKLYQKYEAQELELYELNNLFGAVITSGEPVISNDPKNDPRSSKKTPPGHPELENFLGIPFKHGYTLIGIAGVANRPGGYDEKIVKYLEPFLATCANLIEAVRIEQSRRAAEESLKNSLQEKITLLRELHHRVKNNLQLIISLLNLQARRAKSSDTVEILQNMRDRVKAITLVHEMLYTAENFSKINMREYISKLATNLFTALKTDTSRIKLVCEIDDIKLDINLAINLGIIINELISNAIKYAFPKNRTGTIKVKFLQLSHNLYKLDVENDGISLPADFNLEKSDTLGLQLCKQLAQHIGGELRYSSGEKTVFSIQFYYS